MMFFIFSPINYYMFKWKKVNVVIEFDQIFHWSMLHTHQIIFHHYFWMATWFGHNGKIGLRLTTCGWMIWDHRLECAVEVWYLSPVDVKYVFGQCWHWWSLVPVWKLFICNSMCGFFQFLRVYPHKWHWKVLQVFLSCFFCKYSCVNWRSHFEHLNIWLGSLTCSLCKRLICIVKSDFRIKFREQYEHFSGLQPVWMRMCNLILYGPSILPHK